MKVLNLYAGIGGNRKLWPKECEVTAIENNQKIAEIYQDFFPYDLIYVEDAHQYLLDHYKDFDFIWSSPPCPTHSRARFLGQSKTNPVYPDMRLYAEIIFLKHHFKGLWVVENVQGYYEPLLICYARERHFFWSNFNIPSMDKKTIFPKDNIKELQKIRGIDLFNYKINKIKVLRNCVNPELGLDILNCAFKEKQQTL